jgi:hypothetical protein
MSCDLGQGLRRRGPHQTVVRRAFPDSSRGRRPGSKPQSCDRAATFWSDDPRSEPRAGFLTGGRLAFGAPPARRTARIYILRYLRGQLTPRRLRDTGAPVQRVRNMSRHPPARSDIASRSVGLARRSRRLRSDGLELVAHSKALRRKAREALAEAKPAWSASGFVAPFDRVAQDPRYQRKAEATGGVNHRGRGSDTAARESRSTNVAR